MFNGKFNNNIINNKQIFDVIRKTLSFIDPVLINHGERVAYIALEIVKDCKYLPSLDLETLYILCLLHDVGAYKTEEIQNMVTFETANVDDHSIYGYVFLKNLTPLKSYAMAILTHHFSYNSIKDEYDTALLYGQIIHLADRIDIMLKTSLSDCFLEKQKNLFDPILYEAYISRKEFIRANFNDENILQKYEDFNMQICVHNQDIWQYLFMLVFAIDFRSNQTINHTMNTASISLELGKLLNLSQQELEELFCGAILHDLGKIAIPDHILEKPSSLTNEETIIMQKHIVYTEEIIKEIVDKKICNIACRHHEKLNGRGYPHNLSSTDLSLVEQILATSDIFSALTLPRSYKPAFKKETVISILNDMVKNGELNSNLISIVILHYDELIKSARQSGLPIIEMHKNLITEFDTVKKSHYFKNINIK